MDWYQTKAKTLPKSLRRNDHRIGVIHSLASLSVSQDLTEQGVITTQMPPVTGPFQGSFSSQKPKYCRNPTHNHRPLLRLLNLVKQWLHPDTSVAAHLCILKSSPRKQFRFQVSLMLLRNHQTKCLATWVCSLAISKDGTCDEDPRAQAC